MILRRAQIQSEGMHGQLVHNLQITLKFMLWYSFWTANPIHLDFVAMFLRLSAVINCRIL